MRRQQPTNWKHEWILISFWFGFRLMFIIEWALAEFQDSHYEKLFKFSDFINSVLFLFISPPFTVCGSKDIRNSVKNLKELRGCRVIEGFLIITLIDKYNETDYDGMEFPELTEVTDFVLLYRVNGLKSVGKLFPNLRIIRGNNLIHDFAFVVFEMMHLQVKRICFQ